MSFLDNLKKETTVTQTENGAVTYSTSLNKNLDLYAQAGAIRSRLEDARLYFNQAYAENELVAIKNLFYLRDARGGLGERSAFREMFKALIDVDVDTATKLAELIPLYGRWDDLVEVYVYAKKNSAKNKHFIKKSIDLIKSELQTDMKYLEEDRAISQIGKWLPSPSVSSKKRKAQANTLAHDLHMNIGSYRKMLSKLRGHLNIVETNLTDRNYDRITFEKLPSRALYKYRQAFQREMTDKYDKFLEKVDSGEVAMNASHVLPYEIVRDYINKDNYSWEFETKDYNAALEATWKSLDNTLEGLEENAIVVADTSASMGGDPWYVAESLAIFCAERLEGVFKNHFITFSTSPKLIELPDNGTLKAKMDEYHKHSIVSDTDIEKVFDLILRTAVRNNTLQKELPSKIIIISDMEFNQATAREQTNFQRAKEMFNDKGYELPEIVFWNVDSRQNNLPVRDTEKGVALVSGLTPSIFKQVLSGKILNPVDVMINTLNGGRYDYIDLILASVVN